MTAPQHCDPIQVAREVARAIDALEAELETLRAERSDYRRRWLDQVDINDKLRGLLAEHMIGMQTLEAMGRE